MEDIYSKIKIAEEHLRKLRTTLEDAEKAYEIHGKKVVTPCALAAFTLPFVNSTCASAKAAVLASGSRPR